MLTWLADVLRAAGLPVREVDGWRTRGHGAMGDVLGVLAHHTAGAATGNYPSEQIVVNGRAGLPGPLANLGLARDGTWVVIAAGVAWHAGTGSAPWCPADQGNTHLIGVEAESVGTRDDWTAAQRESYPRGVAALLRHLELPAARAIGHKEWAPARKIDPAYWDMDAFRADVARWMNATAQGDDVAWTHGDGAPSVPDYYPGATKDLPDPLTALGFATAHAAVSRDEAKGARADIAALRADIATGRVSVAPEIDYDRLAAALVPQLLAALTGKPAA